MKQEKRRWQASMSGTSFTYGEDKISILVEVFEPEREKGRQIEFFLNRTQADGLIQTLRGLIESPLK